MAVPHLCHSRHRLSYRIPLVRSKLCRLLELLEPDRQSIPIRTILTRRGLSINVPAIPSAQVRGKGPRGFRAAYRRREFGNQVDADQVGVEGHVVDFGQRQATRDHRLF